MAITLNAGAGTAQVGVAIGSSRESDRAVAQCAQQDTATDLLLESFVRRDGSVERLLAAPGGLDRFVAPDR